MEMAAITTLEVHNVPLQKDRPDEVSTPTTPRPNLIKPQAPFVAPSLDETRSPQTQGPLASHPPSEPPVTHDEHCRNAASMKEESHLETQSSMDDKWNSMDIDTSDHEQDGSDQDTENGEPETSTRKKKGQRFFCTGYAPCNLSFTRSEHLARHIRKHTGERPFQCHCNRRFSRLDNLRQHAQTVHVNEEIPTDSLAATGTRFQRQIRTDRVRATGRPRTNTMSSTGSQGRGHSRNTSTSSIGSTSSNFSTATEPRRRPPPLLMANDGSGRPKLGLDLPGTPPAHYHGYGDSPGGLSTPTSTAYSATPGSPGYGSSMGSPSSNTSRHSGFFASRPPSRRLSVPSGPNPFQPSFQSSYQAPYMTPMASSSNVSTNSSVYASPVSTTFSSGGPIYHTLPAEDWRRRTWHPSTWSNSSFSYARPATSGLTYSQTPDAPQPAYAQHATAAAGPAPRLPGIESFDQVQHRPSTPPRRQPSPMQLDSAPQPPSFTMAPGHPQVRSSTSGPRPGHVSWDFSRPSNYSINEMPVVPQREPPSWSQQTINEIHSVGSRHDFNNRQSNMGPPALSTNLLQSQQIAREALQIQAAAKRNRRHGWYNGPLTATRTSPEDSSSSEGVPTPGTSNAEIHPAIVHSNGYIEPHHHHQMLAPDGQANICLPSNSVPSYHLRGEHARGPPAYHDSRNVANKMTGLEALVAVATSEDKATASVR